MFRYLLILYLISNSLLAQDFHLSQYFASPLYLNPAFTGVFDGDIRFIINYRDQWENFAQFKTYSSSFDASLLRKKLNGNFWGVGGMFFNDVFGNNQFISTQVGISSSYNQLLSNHPKQYLSYGVQLSLIQRQLNTQNLKFGTSWEKNTNYDPMVPDQFSNVHFFDLSAGLLWYGLFNKKTSIYSGVAMFHITEPDQSFLEDNQDRLLGKWVIHSGAEIESNTEFGFLPSLLFIFQGPIMESNFGSYIKYNLDKLYNTSIYVGGWYRFVSHETNIIGSDALILGTRLDVKNFNIGFSYDLNTSNLRSISNLKGGPEIYLIYCHQIEKIKQRVRYCPKF